MGLFFVPFFAPTQLHRRVDLDVVVSTTPQRGEPQDGVTPKNGPPPAKGMEKGLDHRFKPRLYDFPLQKKKL